MDKYTRAHTRAENFQEIGSELGIEGWVKPVAEKTFHYIKFTTP